MARILVIGGLADSLVNFRGILLSEMVARGHEVIACAAEDNREIADKLTAMGVRYTPLHFRRAGLNPLGDLALLFRLLGVLRQLRPDIVLCYTIKPVIYGALACRLTGIKQCYAMITGLGYAFMGGKGLRQKWVSMLARTLYRAALTGTAGVFFQNPDDLALFIETGLLRERYKALVINGSGIDTRYFSPAALPHDPVVFLLIARLLKDKGIFEYASAAAILKQRYPEAIFRLLGPHDPNPNAISSDQLRTWQQAGVLDYLGEASDVRPHLAASCVYVLPSYREGTPRTVLEAMSMGRPVITTDAPGCRETVTDGDNGFLVPVKDSSALAHAMERFILAPELMPLMGARGREIACLKYDVHAVNDTILHHMNLDSDVKTPV
jgi:glycosyltransferase involved in cell wall biosynthesis